MRLKTLLSLIVVIGGTLLIVSCITLLGDIRSYVVASVTSVQDKNSAVNECTLTTRTVTFSSDYFEHVSQARAISGLENLGCYNIVVHRDGSITVTMPLDLYRAIVHDKYCATVSTLDDLMDSYQDGSVSEIIYGKDFSNVTIKIGSHGFVGNLDAMAYRVGQTVTEYQQIAGLAVHSVVTVVGPQGDVIAVYTFPSS